MPGYLDGQAPSNEDVQAIANHLSGNVLLSDERLLRADLDRDGQVSVADLQIMLKLVTGVLSLPLPHPVISAVEPSIVRPGDSILIEGDDFGNNIADLQIYFGPPESLLQFNISSLSNTEITAVVPNSINISIERNYSYLRILRQGVTSNIFSLLVQNGPICYQYAWENTDLRSPILLTGKGFGNDLNVVRVKFGELSVSPLSVQEEEIRVSPPTEITQATELRVEVSDLASNSLAFYPRGLGNGLVSLPVGSTLTLSNLKVISPTGDALEVDPSGNFSFVTSEDQISSFELWNESEEVVFATLRVSDETLGIDALSTAVWLVFNLIVGNSLIPTKARLLLNGLKADESVSRLAENISNIHSSEPVLQNQMLNHTNEVSAALAQATVSGINIYNTLIQEGLGV